MKNGIKSKIVIEIENIDHAKKLVEALKMFTYQSSMGGDSVMYIELNNKMISCGFIGHDVNIKKVFHVIEKNE